MSAAGTRFGHGALAFVLQVAFFAIVTVATLVWGWIGLAVAAAVSFVVQLLVGVGLARSRARRYPPRRHPGTPLRWYPKVSAAGLLSGLVLGIGGVMVLQQFGLTLFDFGRLIQAIVAGALAGIVVPSMYWAVTVARYNRRLRRSGVTATAAGMGAAAVIGWIAAISAAFTAFGTAEAEAARADQRGSCEMTLGGVSVAELGIDNPVEVADRDVVLPYTFTKPAGITAGWGALRYFGTDIPIFSQGDDDVDPDGDGPGTDVGDLPIGMLLSAGTGLYEGTVRWTFADGTSCSGSAVFDLIGDPLTTPLGAASTALVAAGAVGLVAGAIASGAGSLTPLRTLPGSGAGATPPLIAEPRTVVLSGDAARDALERLRQGGPGTAIDLPEDEQWDLYAEAGGTVARSGFVGTEGTVQRIGAIVESGDELTIALEVIPIGTVAAAAAPSPSDIVIGGGAEASAVSGAMPGSGDAAAAVDGSVAEPGEAGSPVPATAMTAEPPVNPGNGSEPATVGPVVPPAPPAVAPPTGSGGTGADAVAAEGVADGGFDTARAAQAIETLRTQLPTWLGPLIDALEPLALSGAGEATIPPSLIPVEGISFRDGMVVYDALLVEARLTPQLTADGGLTILARGEAFGFDAPVPEKVTGLIEQKLAPINEALRDAGVRLDSIEITPDGIRVSGSPR